MICENPEAFFQEIDEKLLIMGEEIRPAEAIPDRIDILAVDDNGQAVVIELKRGTHKLQLLQALSYAGMVSRWSAKQFVDTLANSLQQAPTEAQEAIAEHIGSGSDISSIINNKQRVLLIAEEFDPALLFAAEWLYEKYDVDIRCHRLELSQENGVDYLTCTRVYPPTEIASLTRGGIAKTGQTVPSWTDWNSALSSIDNSAVSDFIRSEVGRHQEARLGDRSLIYRVEGKRRFWLHGRKRYAYVWQRGRFYGDDAFWRKSLTEPNYIQTVERDQALRFRLTSVADFAAFDHAMKTDLAHVEFTEGDGSFEQPAP